MAKYKTDLEDIYFNLFELLEVQNNTDVFEVSDMKEIIREFDKFVEHEVFPTRKGSDEEGVKLEDGGVKVPKCFQKPNQLMYENGWFGLGLPEELGGIPSLESVTTACSSIITGANVSFSMYCGLSKAAMNVIRLVGTKEQKDTYIEKMCQGAWGGTMCLTEAGAGSDVGAIQTTATKNDDGTYKIHGTKIFISSGDNDLYENIIHLVLARIPGAPEGTKGISLFIVPKMKHAEGSVTGSNDVLCTKVEDKMGIHAQATCELLFGDSGDCAGELIGKENEGIVAMFIMMNEARLMCGIQGESQANLVYELTLQYAKERIQFGTEIANLPNVKTKLLGMRAMCRGLRALHLYAANLFDLGELGKKWAPAEVALLTPICKGYGSENGFNVAVDAIQTHGGYGYCTDYGIDQFARDTKIATIYEGTNEIQAIDFVTRKILKDQGKALMALGGKIENTLKTKEAAKWPQESALMGQSLTDAGKIMKVFGDLASKNQFNEILEGSHEFMTFCANLITSWLLLKSAIIADGKIESSSGDQKKYYESKVVDYQVFAQRYLVNNLGLAKRALEFSLSYSKVEI